MANRVRGLLSNCKILLPTESPSFLKTSTSLAEIEKKATSDPDIKPEQTTKISIMPAAKYTSALGITKIESKINCEN